MDRLLTDEEKHETYISEHFIGVSEWEDALLQAQDAKTAQIIRAEIIEFLETNHFPDFWKGSVREEKLWQDFKAGKATE